MKKFSLFLLIALAACASKETPRLDQVSLNEVLQTIRLAPYPNDKQRVGWLVQYVEPNSAWTRRGIREGDVLMKVDGKPVIEKDAAVELFTTIASGSAKRVEILRNKGKMTL